MDAWQIFATVVSGTTVYVLGQITVKILIDPLQEMRRLIGRIAHSLMYDANLLCTPSAFSSESRIEVYKRLRGFASELGQQTHLVPHYDVLARSRFVPRLLPVLDAIDKLILLSNRLLMNRGDVSTAHTYLMEQIKASLGIEELPDSPVTKEEFAAALRDEQPSLWASTAMPN